jgi:glycosyltransferase involved in cell wall biosynthesis
VIEHGVIDPGYRYSGELERGLVVINHLVRRGRRVGADLFFEARKTIPLDLVGMAAEEAGGLREVLHAELPEFSARYRFLFNPIRYTSLGLAVIESMMTGLPIVALGTTEMVTVIRDGVNGHIDTDLSFLIRQMDELMRDGARAVQLGIEARRTALARFNIERFVRDWNDAFSEVTGPCSERSGPISRGTASGSA